MSGTGRKIRENLQNRFRYEKEKVYEQLSQEDREALELGRQIQRERQEDGRRKAEAIWKIALNLAAALVLVSVLGITSLGGPADRGDDEEGLAREKLYRWIPKTIEDC